MSESALDKLELYPGEQVVWSSVQTGAASPRNPLPKKSTKDYFAMLCFVGVWFGYVAFTGDGSAKIKIAAIFVFLAVLPILRRIKALEKLYAWFGRFSPGQMDTYLSCVITDRRVMLFDLLGETPVSLNRSRLDRVWQDFAEGGQALLFRLNGMRTTHAFVSTIEFKPALDALDLHRNTP